MRKQILLLLFFFAVLSQAHSQIVSISPDTGMQGQSLTTTITMVNGTIGMGSPPFQQTDLYLQQGGTIIYNNYINWFWMMDYGDANFNIPPNAPLGYYDLHVTTYDNFMNPTNWTLPNSFFIKPYAGTVEGDLFLDINQNGLRDGGEPGLYYGSVTLAPNGPYVYANAQGHYKAYLDVGNYTVAYNPYWSYTQTSLPLNYTANVPPSYSGMDFGAYSFQALYGHWLSTWRHPFKCQPSKGYSYISAGHYGIMPVDGKVTFIHSNNLVVDSVNPLPDMIIGDTMIWYYDSLTYGNTFHVGGGGGWTGWYMSFLDPPAGDTVWYVANDSIWDHGNGTFVNHFVDSFNFVVTCSCDPNDKNVFPTGVGAQHITPPNTELSFTINFQNTGNDTAFNVTIADTLDPDLDWSSFQIQSSTHPVFAQMDNNGVVTFTFENIFLPDSNVDEPGSHGAVVYTIRTDSLLPDPTEITNTSYIYFDWNSAVVTNTTLNTISEMTVPSAGFSTSNLTICPGTCIDYTSTPNPGSTYSWSFPGANPSTSTDENPTNICYLSGGLYDATLIVSNSLGSDTAYYADYLTVWSLPSLAISQLGDTLYSVQGFASYVWYYNGNIINGATDYFYVATQDGDYSVVGFDTHGCSSQAVINDVVLSVSVKQVIPGTSISIYPNPAGNWFEVSGVTADAVSVYNIVGERVIYEKITGSGTTNKINIAALPAGSYSVEVISGDKSYRTSIVKQ
jgi:uncharacterized repeat protein (TIGR01451 family)